MILIKLANKDIESFGSGGIKATLITKAKSPKIIKVKNLRH